MSISQVHLNELQAKVSDTPISVKDVWVAIEESLRYTPTIPVAFLQHGFNAGVVVKVDITGTELEHLINQIDFSGASIVAKNIYFFVGAERILQTRGGDKFVVLPKQDISVMVEFYEGDDTYPVAFIDLFPQGFSKYAYFENLIVKAINKSNETNVEILSSVGLQENATYGGFKAYLRNTGMSTLVTFIDPSEGVVSASVYLFDGEYLDEYKHSMDFRIYNHGEVYMTYDPDCDVMLEFDSVSDEAASIEDVLFRTLKHYIEEISGKTARCYEVESK